MSQNEVADIWAKSALVGCARGSEAHERKLHAARIYLGRLERGDFRRRPQRAAVAELLAATGLWHRLSPHADGAPSAMLADYGALSARLSAEADMLDDLPLEDRLRHVGGLRNAPCLLPVILCDLRSLAEAWPEEPGALPVARGVAESMGHVLWQAVRCLHGDAGEDCPLPDRRAAAQAPLVARAARAVWPLFGLRVPLPAWLLLFALAALLSRHLYCRGLHRATGWYGGQDELGDWLLLWLLLAAQPGEEVPMPAYLFDASRFRGEPGQLFARAAARVEAPDFPRVESLHVPLRRALSNVGLVGWLGEMRKALREDTVCAPSLDRRLSLVWRPGA
ncbi:hypothetical protein [Alkalilimnicola sp. S0819]|uniref:hypothetical protein n=1 Tax=Alkalilimnicola sp. S0819 TaxID=2613922 RepID=UPI001261BF3D|nr:hypothetical protein [Alkalilimnicola sp. S0819]KAB7627849.1 hypothetical protein F3N43_02420 [Alkalilimnicola sp. S0819]MPQ15483.1 hypothetical protein [Alkalilimnicola sp. S0819]